MPRKIQGTSGRAPGALGLDVFMDDQVATAVAQDPPNNLDISSDTALWSAPQVPLSTEPANEGSSCVAESLHIPAELIVQHTVTQATAPSTHLKIPLVVRWIAHMLLSLSGMSCQNAPSIISDLLLIGKFGIYYQIQYRFSEIWGATTGPCPSYDCWSLVGTSTTIWIYPELKEAITFRFNNGKQVLLDHLLSRLRALYVQHEQILLQNRCQRRLPQHAPLHPGNGHRGAAMQSSRSSSNEPNCEPTDASETLIIASTIGATDDPPILAEGEKSKKEFICRISGCTKSSTTSSNRNTHEAQKHNPPQFECLEIICARKSNVEIRSSGTRCTPDCQSDPCGGTACGKPYTQRWSLARHVSEVHSLIPLLGCPVETCNMRAMRHGQVCNVHHLKVTTLKKSL